jgi:dipeptidyl aminopeptidase/acylaminoacyl peptidase
LPPTVVLVFSRSGLMLQVERDDGRVDTTQLPQPMGRVSALRFSADGKLLAAGRDDGSVEIFDIIKRTRTWSAWRHDGVVRSLAFASDNTRLVSAGEDAYAIVWSINGGSQIFRTARHGGAISSAAFSSDGRRVVTASEDGTAKIWDGDSGRLILSLDGHGARVTDAAFAPHANLVATVSADGFSRLWDADTGRMVQSLKHPGELLAMQFSPRGDLLATASNQAAAAYLRSARLETRPAADVLAEIASGSRWKVENEFLVGTRPRAGGDVRDEPAPSPAAVRDARNQPEEVASAFLTALEQGRREVLVSLLASVASAGLRETVLKGSAEDQRSLGALSAGRRVISTVIRDDKMAALTTYEVKGGNVGVWTVNERGLWKARELNSRSASATR